MQFSHPSSALFLVRMAVDLEPILGPLDTRQEYTLLHSKGQFRVNSFTISCFWTVKGNQRTQRKLGLVENM